MPGAISQLLAKVVDIFFSESGQNMATSGVGIPVGPDGAVRHIFAKFGILMHMASVPSVPETQRPRHAYWRCSAKLVRISAL